MALDLFSDVLIPVAAILVPTGIAIWLAQTERKAAAEERAEERARGAADRVAEGVEAALDAMTDLTEAGFTTDIQKAAAIRVRAGRRLAKIAGRLGPDNVDVTNWVSRELAIIAQGLEKRDAANVPLELEYIIWRGAHFTDALTDWGAGEKKNDWFAEAEHLGLSKTTEPGWEAPPLS